MKSETYYPSLESFLEQSRSANRLTVSSDYFGDTETPVTAYAKLRGFGPSFMLESVVGGEKLARYSFLGCDPDMEIVIYQDKTVIRHRNGEVETRPTGADPLDHLEQFMRSCKTLPHQPDQPVFTGGAVGFVSYEYVHAIEPTVPCPQRDDLGMPIAYFLVTESVVIFDHARQKLTISASVDASADPQAAYKKAVDAIQRTRARLSRNYSYPLSALSTVDTTADVQSSFARADFEKAVMKVKEYIVEGDVFQTVLSQRFSMDYPLSPLDLYRSLRNVNPSPYMVLLESPEFAVVSASPEIHVKLQDRQVEIRPIAGTRPRGNTWEDDLALEKDLLADRKEKAEHLMLVDLARNDIGRVCKIGSVEIPQFMIIERYSHVMHIVSQVLGVLDDDKSAFDLLRATFPAGTVSGAPKVRAMQIISDLENAQRGVYSGALGYFSFDGNHDSCIAIRTAVIKNGRIHFQSGAGIVADSKPENEYEETLNKAKGMLRAVQQSLAFDR